MLNSSTNLTLRLFPYLHDINDVHMLKIDKESVHYITVREDADKITNIIINHLDDMDLDSKDTVVTDATSGVGGNTLSFAKKFKKVVSVEIDKDRCNYLTNNIKVYEMNNVEVVNDDCVEYLSNITDHDVIFIDPPWGGRMYKKYSKLNLTLSGVPLEHLCNTLFNDEIMLKVPKMVVLKLPTNYDIDKILYIIDRPIKVHNVKKMMIVVIM